MKYFMDTEFIEDGKTIELLSIGIVSEDGRSFYAEADWTDHSLASPWVQENVIPLLNGSHDQRMDRENMARAIVEFVRVEKKEYSCKPEFWAYYADYDWVVLCQLFGTMMELPTDWPMFCMDLKQLTVMVGNPALPEQADGAHNALDDARWVRDTYYYVMANHVIDSRIGGLGCL